MSYCLAIRTASGLVFASDSRTHGGVDDVNAYSKMHRFDAFGDRVFVLLSAGNLSTTQAVLRRLREGVADAAHASQVRGASAPGRGGGKPSAVAKLKQLASFMGAGSASRVMERVSRRQADAPGAAAEGLPAPAASAPRPPEASPLTHAETVFDAAEGVGRLSRAVREEHRADEEDARFGASFILGGQIAGQPPELCLIYPEGNCIVPSPEKPFLQIGETQYGKPILDRFVTFDTPLADAARCALVSLDSTMRSNLAVGPPLELAVLERDGLAITRHERFEADAPFLLDVQASWSATVARGMRELPRFPWEAARGSEARSA